MQILAVCGRKASTVVLQSRQVSTQGNADDLGSAQAGEQFELFQNLQIGTIQSNSSRFLDGLHDPSNLQGEVSTLDDRLHAKLQPAYACHSNDIHKQPENSPSVIDEKQASVSAVSTYIITTETPALEPKALPLDWILGPKSASLVDRVLARLVQAEAHEVNPHFRDDIRIAWTTALYASEGRVNPHFQASISVLGVPPDQVWARIQDRRRAQLGREIGYFFDENGNLLPEQSSPKKFAASVAGNSAERKEQA